MRVGGLARFAPLAGVGFIVLGIASFVVGGEPPGSTDSTREVVDYWSDEGKQIASAVLAAISTLFFVWFASSLRSALGVAEGGIGRVASIAFAGAVIFATGLLANAAIQFAAAETAGDVPVQVTQTLSVLYADFFFPMAAGLALLLLATGLVAVRTGVLPRWLGWVSLVLGVLAVTPLGFFVFLAGLVWIVVVSVLLFLRGGEAASPGSGPPAPA